MIKLTYFKKSGKYHDEGEYETEKIYPYEVFEEVREMLSMGIRPGLVDGVEHYNVLVTGDDIYPALIMANTYV